VKKLRIVLSIFLGLMLVGLFGASCAPEAVERGGQNVPIYFTQGGEVLVVGSGGTLDIQSGATIDFDAGANAGMGGTVVYDQTSITPANASTLTVTSTFYEVNSAAPVTVTLGTTGATAGQVLYLYGDDNNTITIADTNLKSTDGNAVTFGQFDAVGFIFDGANWVLLFNSGNQ
jgi:hypothetical protein